MITQLLEKANKIIVCDGGFNFLSEYYSIIQNKTIYSIGDMDSITQETKQFIQQNKNIIFLHDTDQDTTDSQKALNFLYNHYQQKQEQQPITILTSAFGGRLDHQLYNIGLIYKEIKFRNHCVIGLDKYNCEIIIDKNITYKIQLPKTNEQTIGILPIDQDIFCYSQGLLWDLNNTKLSYSGLLSTSNGCQNQEKQFYLQSSDYAQVVVTGQY